MWTSGKDTHCPLSGPAYAVEIDKNGELLSFFESAITIWMQYHRSYRPDEGERKRGESIANRMIAFLKQRGIRQD